MKPGYTLRSNPIIVSEKDAGKTFLLKKISQKFGDDIYHIWKSIQYIKNRFQDNGDGTITDLSTGLMWQQSGSDDIMQFDQTQTYIQSLNQNHFAGYSDWRLPTIPELMSLLEAEVKNGDRYIDSLFDEGQIWCWSSDRVEDSFRAAWGVSFDRGGVGHSVYSSNSAFVRGMRIQTMSVI